MSLIKAVDVPKYMADKMLSRRIGARLASGAGKPTLVVSEPVVVPPVVK